MIAIIGGRTDYPERQADERRGAVPGKTGGGSSLDGRASWRERCRGKERGLYGETASSDRESEGAPAEDSV